MSDINKHLKFWLKLEETSGTTAFDVLKSNNGTLVGSGLSWAPGSGRPARDGKSCLFIDGTSNNHVLIENSAGEVWNGSSSFTVAMWVYRVGNNTATSAQFAFCHAGGTTNNRIYITVGASSAGLAFTVGNSAVGAGTNSFANARWTHVALSYNALNGKSYSYVDGKLVSTATTALGTGSYDIYLGALSDTTNQVINGAFDDVRFYDAFMKEPDIKGIIQGVGYAR